jgi:transcriptional regulator with PAS, ATPase and Fis domain
LLILHINIKCPLKLDENAIQLLQKFRWSGNIRQLQCCRTNLVLETNRDISAATLQSYLPVQEAGTSVIKDQKSESDFSVQKRNTKYFFDMKSEVE